MARFDEMGSMFFRAYGGNSFGNKIPKLSWNDKVLCVDNNKHPLLNYQDGELIQQSDNKFLFTSFCIEYKRGNPFLENTESSTFVSYLPIQ